MVKALYILGVATLAVFANAADDYCDLESCDGPNHTVCRFGMEKTDEQACGMIESSSLTDDEIQEILDTHNEMRSYVASGQEDRGNPGPQPAATNLGPLEWDDELASIAQSWADQCNFNHDTCRNVDRFQVGQNIAYMASTGGYGTPWSQVMEVWYNEVDDFNAADVDALPEAGFENFGHYTQLMWADTKYVGCGGIRYSPDGTWHKTYLVCNYGPAGNLIGSPLYETA